MCLELRWGWIWGYCNVLREADEHTQFSDRVFKHQSLHIGLQLSKITKTESSIKHMWRLRNQCRYFSASQRDLSVCMSPLGNSIRAVDGEAPLGRALRCHSSLETRLARKHISSPHSWSDICYLWHKSIIFRSFAFRALLNRFLKLTLRFASSLNHNLHRASSKS